MGDQISKIDLIRALVMARAAWAARNGLSVSSPVLPNRHTFGANLAADLAAYEKG